MFDDAQIRPVPQEPLTEDEMRSIAADYVRGHGSAEEPDMPTLFTHLIDVLTKYRTDPVMPDEQSMTTIRSLIRRATVAVELPADLQGPTLTLDGETTRAWARYIHGYWGPGVGSNLVRKALATEYADELAEETVDTIIELVNDARSLVQLPGDTEYLEAPYPGREDPSRR